MSILKSLASSLLSSPDPHQWLKCATVNMFLYHCCFSCHGHLFLQIYYVSPYYLLLSQYHLCETLLNVMPKLEHQICPYSLTKEEEICTTSQNTLACMPPSQPKWTAWPVIAQLTVDCANYCPPWHWHVSFISNNIEVSVNSCISQLNGAQRYIISFLHLSVAIGFVSLVHFQQDTIFLIATAMQKIHQCWLGHNTKQ